LKNYQRHEHGEWHHLKVSGCVLPPEAAIQIVSSETRNYFSAILRPDFFSDLEKSTIIDDFNITGNDKTKVNAKQIP